MNSKIAIGLFLMGTFTASGLSSCTTKTYQQPTTEFGKTCAQDADASRRHCVQRVRDEEQQCLDKERAQADIPYKRALEDYYDQLALKRQCEEENERIMAQWRKLPSCIDIPRERRDSFKRERRCIGANQHLPNDYRNCGPSYLPQQPKIGSYMNWRLCEEPAKAEKKECQDQWEMDFERCGGAIINQ